MGKNESERNKVEGNGFVRIGGFAILVGFVIHIILNMVLKKFPPENPALDELTTYLINESGTWAIIHGFRYVAFVCIAIFAAALFMRTNFSKKPASTGWGIFGLLGAAFLITNGMLTNGIETLVFTNFDWLSEDPRIFWAFFYLTRVLFTAEVVSWGMIIGGFSIAGWITITLPKWFSILGFLSAGACILSGVFIVSILTNGATLILIDIGSILSLLWFLICGFFLVIEGNSNESL